MAEVIPTSVGTPQLNSPGGLMVAESILDINFEGKCSSWASRSQNFACGACNNGYVKRSENGLFLFSVWGAPRPWGGASTFREIKNAPPGAVDSAVRSYEVLRPIPSSHISSRTAHSANS